MAIVTTLELPGATTGLYDQLNVTLGIRDDDDVPDGLVSHICGDTGEGLVVIDVWESVQALQQFAPRVGKALADAGQAAPAPTVRQLHAMIPRGRGTEANVVMLAYIDATPADYDELVRRLDVTVGGPEQYPCVSHVAAVSADGGMQIVDLWDSVDAFGAFARGVMAPAAGERMRELTPQFVRVHNRFVGRVPAAVA